MMREISVLIRVNNVESYALTQENLGKQSRLINIPVLDK